MMAKLGGCRDKDCADFRGLLNQGVHYARIDLCSLSGRYHWHRSGGADRLVEPPGLRFAHLLLLLVRILYVPRSKGPGDGGQSLNG